MKKLVLSFAFLVPVLLFAQVKKPTGVDTAEVKRANQAYSLYLKQSQADIAGFKSLLLDSLTARNYQAIQALKPEQLLDEYWNWLVRKAYPQKP